VHSADAGCPLRGWPPGWVLALSGQGGCCWAGRCGTHLISTQRRGNRASTWASGTRIHLAGNWPHPQIRAWAPENTAGHLPGRTVIRSPRDVLDNTPRPDLGTLLSTETGSAGRAGQLLHRTDGLRRGENRYLIEMITAHRYPLRTSAEQRQGSPGGAGPGPVGRPPAATSR